MNIALLIVGVLLFWWVFVYSVHVACVLSQPKVKYGFASFKTFLKMYNNYRWERDPKYKDGHYAGLHTMIQSWQIEFEGRYMILYPHSFIQFLIWSHNNRNREKYIKPKRNVIKWENEL